MTERPILFSGAMVRALLAGTKTQTRRALRRQPYEVALVESGNHLLDFRCDLSDYSGVIPMRDFVQKSPYGQAGGRLWVRENGWERPERTPKMIREGADTWAPYYYDADGISPQEAADLKAWGFKRRPSIHMPRKACRLVLEVTGVRVERLQEITEADALAEGIDDDYLVRAKLPPPRRMVYSALWEYLNGAGSWASNPWVWAVEFKRAS